MKKSATGRLAVLRNRDDELYMVELASAEAEAPDTLAGSMRFQVQIQ